MLSKGLRTTERGQAEFPRCQERSTRARTRALSPPRVSWHKGPLLEPRQGCMPDRHPPSQPSRGLRPQEERRQPRSGQEHRAGAGSDSALSWQACGAYPLFIPAPLRSSRVLSGRITSSAEGSGEAEASVGVRRGAHTALGLLVAHRRVVSSGQPLGSRALRQAPVGVWPSSGPPPAGLPAELGGHHRTGEAWGKHAAPLS